jgi:hypothetical protein
MKRAMVLVVLLGMGILYHSTARADLDNFLYGLNNQARVNSQDYSLRLSTQFGVGLPTVHSLLGSVAAPADAFMCLQLGRMLGMPPERVLSTYNRNRGQGWGAIAKSLGIKPGSAEFHALKRGDFALTGTPYGGGYRGGDDDQYKGHGKNKGHGKGNGKGQGRGHND